MMTTKKSAVKILPSLKNPSQSLFCIIKSFSSSPSPSPSPSPSQSQSPCFMVDYLIRSLNCSLETAMKASKRLHHIKSPENPDSVISFLRSFGLSQSQLAYAVLRRPLILTSNVQTSLLSKIQLFQSLGASGEELADIVSSSTACFGNSTKNRLIPAVNFLRNILQDDEKVLIAIRKCPQVLAYDPNKSPLRNVEFLKKRGFDSDAIATMVLKSPSVLVLKLGQLSSSCEIVEGMGLSCKDACFADVFHVMKSVPKDTVSDKLMILKSFGFDESCVPFLFRWVPGIFRYADEYLKRKLEFFINEVGYDPETLLKHPFQLGLRLEERLVPRYRIMQILKLKGLLPNEVEYGRLFLLSKKIFVDEYVNKFKDELGVDVVKAYKERKRWSKDASLEDSNLEAVV